MKRKTKETVRVTGRHFAEIRSVPIMAGLLRLFFKMMVVAKREKTDNKRRFCGVVSKIVSSTYAKYACGNNFTGTLTDFAELSSVS